MDVIINGTGRQHWIEFVSRFMHINILENIPSEQEIHIYLKDITEIDQLEPFHLVLLACNRQYLKDLGYNNCFIHSNQSVNKYLMSGINLGAYWRGEIPTDYSQSRDETICNLWRVSKESIEGYSEAIHQYLKRNFFKNKEFGIGKRMRYLRFFKTYLTMQMLMAILFPLSAIITSKRSSILLFVT